MNNPMNEFELRQQDMRLYGPEIAVARAARRQKEWIARELAKNSVSRESSRVEDDQTPSCLAKSARNASPTIHGADKPFPKTEQSYQPSPGCRQSEVAPEGPGSAVNKPLMRKPRGAYDCAHADRDTAGTLSVSREGESPESSSTIHGADKPLTKNLKDPASYL